MKHTKFNTPPNTLDEINPIIWHKLECDENGDMIHVLKTRNGRSAQAALTAPELLAACMKLVEEIYHHPDGVEVLISDDPIQEMIAAIENAMGGNNWAAIKKAKGE